MKKKRLTIVSPFFYPELIGSGKYNGNLADELVRAGYSITVLCSYPIYPNWKPHNKIPEYSRFDITRGGLSVRYPANSLLRRLVLEVWFLMFVLRNVQRLRKADVLLFVSPPSLFIFAILFVGRHVRKLVFVHDLQSIHLALSKSLLKRFVARAIEFIEGLAFRHGDHIFFMSSEMMESVKKRLPSLRASIIYPVVTSSKKMEPSSVNRVLNSNFVNIVYSGALGEKQNPMGLVALGKELISRDEQICFSIFSDGPIFEKLKKDNQCERLVFSNLVSAEDLPHLLHESTLQVIPQASGTSGGSLPSKLPNLLSSGTAIFAICDRSSELASLLNAQKGCFVSNEWDVELNSQTILALGLDAIGKFDRSGDLALFSSQYQLSLIESQFE